MLFFRTLTLAALLVLLILGCTAGFLLYRPDCRRAGARRGRFLTALRVFLIGLLLLVLAEPVLRSAGTALLRPELLVVVDASKSFFLSDAHRSAAAVRAEADALGLDVAVDELRTWTRAQRAERALENNLEGLRAQYNVEMHALAGELHVLNPAVNRLERPFPGLTDLGRPLVDAVLARPSDSLSAVLLLTDGNHHAASDPLQSATFLGRLQVPIVAVGVGATALPKDIAVTDIDATGYVFPGDEVRALVTVRSTGFGDVEVPLEVRHGETVVARTPLTLAPGSRRHVVEVRFTADVAASGRYEVGVPPQADEVSVENNRRSLRLDVLQGRARVLLVDRRPRWQWRYLRDGWSREEHVDVDAFLLGGRLAGSLPDGFPGTREELLAYDVVVLGDLYPSRLPAAWHEMLREFVVARGGTLIVLAGERATPSRWQGTAVEALLPVELLESVPDPRLGAEVARGGLEVSLTSAGETAALTRLIAGRERNARLWELLPRPRWLAPAGRVRPGATVLAAVAPGDAPRLPGFRPPAPGLPPEESAAQQAAFAESRGAVFVTRSLGAGRVLYSGIDATWRWRFRFGNELHDRFWGQAVRWALSESFRGEDAFVRLRTDARVYQPGSTVRIGAWIRDGSGAPWDGERATALVAALASRPEQSVSREPPRRVELSPDPTNNGRFVGEFRLAAETAVAGLTPSVIADGEDRRRFSLRLDIPELSVYADVAEPARVDFSVEPPDDPERLDWRCDEERLKALAELSGGEYFPLERWSEALERLPRREVEQVRLVERSMWDYPLCLSVVILGILLSEWVLRKRWDLI